MKHCQLLILTHIFFGLFTFIVTHLDPYFSNSAYRRQKKKIKENTKINDNGLQCLILKKIWMNKISYQS